MVLATNSIKSFYFKYIFEKIMASFTINKFAIKIQLLII